MQQERKEVLILLKGGERKPILVSQDAIKCIVPTLDDKKFIRLIKYSRSGKMANGLEIWEEETTNDHN